MMRGGRKKVGEYITDLDLDKYLNYVVSTQPLKGVPSLTAIRWTEPLQVERMESWE